jgi:hypothetical protein
MDTCKSLPSDWINKGGRFEGDGLIYRMGNNFMRHHVGALEVILARARAEDESGVHRFRHRVRRHDGDTVSRVSPLLKRSIVPDAGDR